MADRAGASGWPRRRGADGPRLGELVALAAALLALVLAGSACGEAGAESGRRPATTASFTTLSPTRTLSPTSTAVASNRADPRLARIGFRTTGHLRSHYEKHGAEFGRITQAEYLRMAQVLRDAPLSRQVIEAEQARGGIARFDRRTGSFLAFDEHLTIRTFFRPDDGEDYFWRAVRRR